MPVFRYEMVERPTGAIDLPEWVSGAFVEWHKDYSNAPDINLLCREFPKWDGPIYQRIGEYFIAKHKDGRVRAYKHGGKIGIHKHHVWVSEVTGQVRAHPKQGEPGRWEDREMLSTSRSDGFGGSKIFITLDDGRDLILWGPWSSGTPAGYQESSLWLGRGNKQLSPRQGGTGVGAAFSHDLLTRAAARFLPHIELALVTYNYGTFLEPVSPEHAYAPKAFFQQEMDRVRKHILGN